RRGPGAKLAARHAAAGRGPQRPLDPGDWRGAAFVHRDAGRPSILPGAGISLIGSENSVRTVVPCDAPRRARSAARYPHRFVAPAFTEPLWILEYFACSGRRVRVRNV